MWSLALDTLVAVLLGVTIVYAVLLNRKLRTLRRDRAELERVAGHFEAAIRRAEEGLATIRTAADTFQAERTELKRLQDDLRFLIDRAEGLADRLEAGVRSGRDVVRRLPLDRVDAAAAGEATPQRHPIGESRGADFAAAAGTVATAAAPPPPARPLAAGLAARAVVAASRPEAGPAPSESERELLAALAAGR